jgi:hypothetical protein
MGGALRTCHDAVKHTIARSAVDAAGFRVEVEVYGVFTRALREADSPPTWLGVLDTASLISLHIGRPIIGSWIAEWPESFTALIDFFRE